MINGGIINAYGTNARLGKGDWMVVEADESDGTFTKLPATIAVVTNIDPEHLDFYGDVESLHEAFHTFVANIPFYGFAVMCVDSPAVQGVIAQLSDRRVVTYGFTPQADVRAFDIEPNSTGTRFSIEIGERLGGQVRTLDGIHLPMLGQHNVLNALAAAAVALEMGLDTDAVREGLTNFAGVKRRFTRVGEVAGIIVIDDYGHHPVEIAAVLKAARDGAAGRVIAVCQPHRYSRVAHLFAEFCTCFNDADTVIVADIYEAGEKPIAGIDRDALVDGIRAHGHRDVHPLEAPDKLARTIHNIAQSGDFVVCLGAGNITQWANALPDELRAMGLKRTGTEA